MRGRYDAPNAAASVRSGRPVPATDRRHRGRAAARTAPDGAAAARCRAAGLADVELTLHATTSALRNVYCAHCTATSLVEAQVEDVVACPSCGRRLTVFAHASARWGAYLGFSADAEEQC